MRYRNRKFRDYPALTIMEMVIALAIITIIFAAILPQFRVIKKGWDSRQANTEVIQSGRVLIDHMVRNLSKAVRITTVSGSSDANGFIVFQDNDGNNWRYDINSTSSFVEFGLIGSLSDLAGPVNSLTFTCYDACDLDTSLDIATADINDIRYVEAETTFINSLSTSQNKTFTASAYLRTNDEATSDCNLVAWWKLDETSGLNAEDSSGNDNDGTLTNMVGDEWTTGQIDGALEFDGSNDYVDCGNNSSLQITGDLTIAAWVQLATGNSGNYYGIAGKLIDPSGFGLVRHSSNYFRLWMGDGSSMEAISSNTTYTDTDWHHVTGVRRSGTNYLYIDGVEQTATSTRGLSDSGEYAFIGKQYSDYDGRYFDGIIDDVRIYNAALDANEITELAKILRFRDYDDAQVNTDSTSITIPIPTDTNEGDLLIAAVATDGSTTIYEPSGWTEIDQGSYGSAVTLGVWWKLVEASESSTHQFTWSGSEKAYGWIMRFTGHDSSDPINAYATGTDTDSTPTSPAVTSTVDNCLILRLGAFDNDDITVGDPGLPSDHTDITMDESGSAGLFQDGFETDFSLWTDGGTTDWDRATSQVYSGTYSAHAGRWDNDLISDNIDLSSYSSFTIDFWYRDDDIDNQDNVYLQFYDGSWYDNRFELGRTWPEDTWHNYNETVNNSGGDAQYFINNFRIKFEGSSIDNGENLWIDDVTITVPGTGEVSGGAGYIKQASSGSSGTENFTLTAANDARMITIAITPDPPDQGCTNSITP